MVRMLLLQCLRFKLPNSPNYTMEKRCARIETEYYADSDEFKKAMNIPADERISSIAYFQSMCTPLDKIKVVTTKSTI